MRPPALGKIIVVGNLKGGTGKSSIAVNLAATMAALGKKTAMIDADPQATAWQWLKSSRQSVPCWQFAVERLATVPNWFAKTDELRRQYDFVFVDLPAVVTPALASGFMTAHMILVPLTASAIDRNATARVLKFVRITREERPQNPPRVLLIPTRAKAADIKRGLVSRKLSDLKEPIGPAIRESSAISISFQKRCPIATLAPQSPVHSDFLALSARVFSEIERTTDQPTPKPQEVAPPCRQTLKVRRTRPAAADMNPVAQSETVKIQPWWKRLFARTDQHR